MVLEDPLWQDDNNYPARRDRQFIEAVFDTEGVIKTTDPNALLVTPRAAGANMSVDVAPGPWVIKGDDEANQGHYYSRSTAVENLPIGAKPGSNSRIDLVVARVRDGAVTGSVSSDWILEVIPGAVAASPVAPAVPATAIPLADVLVTSTTVSISGGITDRRPTAGSAAYATKTQVAYELIGQVIVPPAGGSISFTNIPQTYRHLHLDVTARGNRAAGDDQLILRLNGDATAAYDWQRLSGSGSAAAALEGIGGSFVEAAVIPAANSPAGAAAGVSLDLHGYASAFHKSITSLSGGRLTAAAGGLTAAIRFGQWRNQAAITQILLAGANASLADGTTARLYGIKGA